MGRHTQFSNFQASPTEDGCLCRDEFIIRKGITENIVKFIHQNKMPSPEYCSDLSIFSINNDLKAEHEIDYKDITPVLAPI